VLNVAAVAVAMQQLLLQCSMNNLHVTQQQYCQTEFALSAAQCAAQSADSRRGNNGSALFAVGERSWQTDYVSQNNA
jgi:hypothetical protein